MSELSPSVASAKVSPFLAVRRGREAVEFYKKAFGVHELYRFDGSDGSVVAQLALGESNFWLSDESPEHKNFSPETLGGSTMHVVITVEDPDAVYNHAVEAGATPESPVKDERYGWRIGKLRDPYGHSWEIGKPLK